MVAVENKSNSQMFANEDDVAEKEQLRKIGTDLSFKHKIVWKNAIGFAILHILALYGLYLCKHAQPLTIFWCKYANIFCRN